MGGQSGPASPGIAGNFAAKTRAKRQPVVTLTDTGLTLTPVTGRVPPAHTISLISAEVVRERVTLRVP
jgi:hypothetical protein